MPDGLYEKAMWPMSSAPLARRALNNYPGLPFTPEIVNTSFGLKPSTYKMCESQVVASHARTPSLTSAEGWGQPVTPALGPSHILDQSQESIPELYLECPEQCRSREPVPQYSVTESGSLVSVTCTDLLLLTKHAYIYNTSILSSCIRGSFGKLVAEASDRRHGRHGRSLTSDLIAGDKIARKSPNVWYRFDHIASNLEVARRIFPGDPSNCRQSGDRLTTRLPRVWCRASVINEFKGPRMHFYRATRRCSALIGCFRDVGLLLMEWSVVGGGEGAKRNGNRDVGLLLIEWWVMGRGRRGMSTVPCSTVSPVGGLRLTDTQHRDRYTRRDDHTAQGQFVPRRDAVTCNEVSRHTTQWRIADRRPEFRTGDPGCRWRGEGLTTRTLLTSRPRPRHFHFRHPVASHRIAHCFCLVIPHRRAVCPSLLLGNVHMATREQLRQEKKAKETYRA
ncbi:hypothetical protein J6590_015387 [Homalodisca vitripennis]|nr:hypothetical protein J6590_015387 [Homalodisca vitripennis]